MTRRTKTLQNDYKNDYQSQGITVRNDMKWIFVFYT